MKQTFTIILSILALLSGAICNADDSPQITGLQEFENLKKKHQSLHLELSKIMRKTPKEQHMKMFKEHNPTRKLWNDFQELESKYSGTTASLKALTWMTRNYWGGGSTIKEQKEMLHKNLQKISQNFCNHPEIITSLKTCQYVPIQHIKPLFEKIINTTENQDILYAAMFYFAKNLTRHETDLEKSKQFFQKLISEKTIYQEESKRYIYSLTNLQIGMTAPEIIGKDVDGKEMRLSDFRGKVVFLDFWGNW